MKSINKVILIGYLGANPEVRYTADQKAVTNFSLATSQQWKDKDGSRKEETQWHRCVAWGKVGELSARMLAKGSPAYIKGRLKTRKWQDKDGSDRFTTEVVVDEFSALSNANKETKPATIPAKKAKGRSTRTRKLI